MIVGNHAKRYTVAMYEQISMFDQTDGGEPETIIWNLWHRCRHI